ncbi:glycine-rich cell wall structural protein 1.0-like [Homalodisca vitripennis]|uniref:glycine-rich cell wall structural protein 1.0-like n=1 Tax=Homalodisca vitripennis TaxID=197043 RepID=UPI001EE9D625|nr:glycine-rich cell wall structural protein 1.0-like [Homalodisca vitripennis]
MASSQDIGIGGSGINCIESDGGGDGGGGGGSDGGGGGGSDGGGGRDGGGVGGGSGGGSDGGGGGGCSDGGSDGGGGGGCSIGGTAVRVSGATSAFLAAAVEALNWLILTMVTRGIHLVRGVRVIQQQETC